VREPLTRVERRSGAFVGRSGIDAGNRRNNGSRHHAGAVSRRFGPQARSGVGGRNADRPPRSCAVASPRPRASVCVRHRSHVPATNYVSERALRPSVIFRKLTNGFRSEWGAQNYSTFRSVVSTAKTNNRSVLEDLRRSLATADHATVLASIKAASRRLCRWPSASLDPGCERWLGRLWHNEIYRRVRPPSTTRLCPVT